MTDLRPVEIETNPAIENNTANMLRMIYLSVPNGSESTVGSLGGIRVP